MGRKDGKGRLKAPRSLVLSQAQVLSFTANIRRACDELERGETEISVEGRRILRISPLQALRNQAQWLETLYLQQNGAKRLPEAWDSLQEP